jgi:polar amino acid transport system substrate-binding protein
MTAITRRQAATTLLATAGAAAMPRITRAAEEALVRVRRAGVLRIGTDTQFPPFDFLEAGLPRGLNYDLFDEIGRDLRFRVSWIARPWDSVLPGLDAGEFDMAGGPVAITRARMERYRFTVPVADATVAFVKRAGDTTVNKPADISGRMVGCCRGTPQLAQLQKFAATVPAIPTIREYADFTRAYADLDAGRIVAVANSLPSLAEMVSGQKDRFSLVQPPFGDRSYLAYVGRKDADFATLMEAIDGAILRIKGDGRLARMQSKWFGTNFSTPDRVTSPTS